MIYKNEDANKKEEKSKNKLNIQNIEYWKKNPDNSLSKYIDSLCQITSTIFYKKYKFIDELSGMERVIFKKLFAGRLAKKIYRLYEYGSR